MSLDITLATFKIVAISAGAWSNLTPIQIQGDLPGTTYEIAKLTYYPATPEYPVGRIVLVPASSPNYYQDPNQDHKPRQSSPQENPQP
jgi:hypothetical protein